MPQDQQTQNALATKDAGQLPNARVLLAGLGNIGSFLAVLLTPHVAFVRLIDRDKVELRNAINQFYGPQNVGQNKVDVTADRIEQFAPHVKVERRVADLEDVPWEDFADVDIALAGLDSLRARQILSEKLVPLQIPYIDGAVGEPLLMRVQVLLPGEACLECSWGAGQYRQLSTEYPCQPGASAQAARTMAPSCAGAATAATMVAQCLRLMGDNPPRYSYEINGDLLVGRVVTSARRRNERCRSPHASTSRLIRLARPFDQATIVDVLDAATEACGDELMHFEFRRGLLDEDLFGSACLASRDQLSRIGHRRLGEFGLTLRDRVVIRAQGDDQTAHVCFHSTSQSLS